MAVHSALSHRRFPLYFYSTALKKTFFLFFVLGGVVSGIERILRRETFGDPYDYSDFVISTLFGGALGWISYYLIAYFLSIAGDLMKGKASDRDYRTVIAWSLVPTILSLFIIIPQFLIYGAGSSSFDFDVYFDSENLLLSAFIIIRAILGIWFLVILVKGIAYIQEFSIGKAILNIFIPFLLIFGIVLAFITLINIAEII
ncbi:YIP1 family protein [Gillisia marina]|uniref:YIP1 family protein n=1 Tax=Gillisia marina TaxID=1167637 RepID=UPI0003012E53|nr:YIP1 family protein [Gillisia marina]